MNINKLIFLGFLASVAAGCASNGGVADSAAGEATQTVDVRVVDNPDTSGGDPNEVICSRTHKVGTNFPRTVCKTRREMEEERRSAQDAMQRQQTGSVRGWSNGRNDGG